MRTIGIGVFAFSMLAMGPAFAGKTKPAPVKPTVVAAAPTEGKKAEETKAAETKPAGTVVADAKATDPKPGEGKPADAKPADKPKAESVEDLLEAAGKSAAEKAKPVEPAPVKETPKKTVIKVPPKPVQPVAPTVVVAPSGTDDNDKDEEAAAPQKLEAVKQTGGTRHRGNFELGNLDCRALDGAGIERKLSARVFSGEEPDLLCRVIVTQPADVASEEHTVTLSVLVAGKETWKQQRKVRMSSIGRRALVFVIPMDKIANPTDQQVVPVTLNAVLSQPAVPAAGRIVKFNNEGID